jgi:hypothetical protein
MNLTASLPSWSGERSSDLRRTHIKRVLGHTAGRVLDQALDRDCGRLLSRFRLDGERECRLTVGFTVNKLLIYLVSSVFCGLAAAGGTTESTGAGADPAPWRRARLAATKLFAKAVSDLERWPAANGGEVVRVVSDMSYLGGSLVRHGFSVRGGSAPLPVRWMEIEPGRKAREASAAADGRFRLRRFSPPEGRNSGWDGAWREAKTDSSKIELPGAVACGGPLDGWALLAHLECLVSGPEARLFVLTNRGGNVVVARRTGERRATVDVADLDGPARRRFESAQVRIELAPPPDTDVSVFGLESEIVLWIDRGSGLPIEIEGRRHGIPGRIRFRLTGFGTQARPVPDVPWPSAARNAMIVPDP